MSDLDLDKRKRLEALARELVNDPWTASPIGHDDGAAAFVSECSPSTILALIERLRRLEEALGDVPCAACEEVECVERGCCMASLCIVCRHLSPLRAALSGSGEGE